MAVLVVALSGAGAGLAAQASDDAVVVLTTDTVVELMAARQVLESRGVRVRAVFPPRLLFGSVPERVRSSVRQLPLVGAVTALGEILELQQPLSATERGALAFFDLRLARQRRGPGGRGR